MKRFLKYLFIFTMLTYSLYAENNNTERTKVSASLVISGGVSLGAYEAGYNWALIKMLTKVKASSPLVDPELSSIAGASAGSINALLSAMYWCQKDSVPLKNHVDDNLFYETWVNLGIEDLTIYGSDPENKSSLFTQDGLRNKGDKIIEHLKKPIFEKNCEVPLGVAVTKVTPIVEEISGIKMKNQNFSVPLTFREKNGQGIVENKVLPPSTAFYLSIPGIEKDRKKVINLLLASGAFPGAFQQIKLDYRYKGKNYSHYFVDGGLYDNVPLDLAISLNKNASTFFFMDPSNIRKEAVRSKEDEEEQIPVGFITTNIGPVFSSFDIMQSMKLYDAINKNFRGNSNKRLVLSSRYHPITGKYLAHFGAFLDINFRVYDYYVGVYDAIYHLAAAFIRHFPERYGHLSQIEIMDYLKTSLGLDENSEALAAYNLFLNTEFHHIKPKTMDRFSAIYNAFDLKKADKKRYDGAEFKTFLTKLDMKYLEESKNSFIAYAKSDIDNMYRRPLRVIVERITTLENERDQAGEPGAFATATSVSAWAGSDLLKEKNGFEFLPLNVPEDEGKEGMRTALRLLPGAIAADIKNGGLSFGYTARYYTANRDIVNGFEAKASYINSDDINDFVRLDVDAFKAYSNVINFGAGASFFGDMKGKFYKENTAYGVNAYVDLMDILRLTYVHRGGDTGNDDYIYLGIENIPSLIYWLNR
ncbi:patatin-like phospholipase family protein [Sulfurovum sp.]|uniref:patatin-like phospholipase family protein n=1 Tax=Sulfurovum sp. TaxID=1969726 RepID=UPI003563735A